MLCRPAPVSGPGVFRPQWFSVSLQGHPVSLHITTFDGASALSDFRLAQILPRLVAISPHIQGLAARFVHLVATTEALTDATHQTLAALLTYGEP